jgi:glutaredoxin
MALSAVIIFSKSYCPHSKRAKGILLDKYNIVPAPHVVELDLHPDGAALQALVGESTGRRTVPNVIINGVSIGGGDETAALDESGGLLDKIKTLAGKKMQVVERRL